MLSQVIANDANNHLCVCSNILLASIISAFPLLVCLNSLYIPASVPISLSYFTKISIWEDLQFFWKKMQADFLCFILTFAPARAMNSQAASLPSQKYDIYDIALRVKVGVGRLPKGRHHGWWGSTEAYRLPREPDKQYRLQSPPAWIGWERPLMQWYTYYIYIDARRKTDDGKQT